MTWPLSADTNIILLLCTWFGGEGEHLPLEIQEYNKLVRWLYQNDYRPENLVDQKCVEMAAQEIRFRPERLIGLLHRSITLGFYLEEWKRRDYWIVGRGDPTYPKRIRQQMRSFAPPILFGLGNPELLNHSTTAVIGPDQGIEQSNEEIQSMAAYCAEHRRTIIAAGKQMISTGVTESGISHGGSVIWVLQESLFGEPLRKPFRRAKAAGKFMMLSGRSPADKRSLTQESEVGRITMALCDSVIYIDGTELSGDRYHMEDAMYSVLNQKKCFVWFMDRATSAAERLLDGGANSWIDMDMAVHEGLFEDRSEIRSQEDFHSEGAEAELIEKEVPGSSGTEVIVDDETKADIEPEKDVIIKTDSPGIEGPVRFGKQLTFLE